MTAINKVIANKEFSLISKINIKNILLGLQRRAQSSFNSRLFFVARFVGKSDSQIFSIKLMSLSNFWGLYYKNITDLLSVDSVVLCKFLVERHLANRHFTPLDY